LKWVSEIAYFRMKVTNMLNNQAAHPHHKMILKDTLRKSNMVVTSVHPDEMLRYVKSHTIQKRSSDSRL